MQWVPVRFRIYEILSSAWLDYLVLGLGCGLVISLILRLPLGVVFLSLEDFCGVVAVLGRSVAAL